MREVSFADAIAGDMRAYIFMYGHLWAIKFLGVDKGFIDVVISRDAGAMVHRVSPLDRVYVVDTAGIVAAKEAALCAGAISRHSPEELLRMGWKI